jgi:hypothetical protein
MIKNLRKIFWEINKLNFLTYKHFRIPILPQKKEKIEEIWKSPAIKA